MSKRACTAFRYCGGADVSAVALVGSWDEWTEQLGMKRAEADGTQWEITKDLEPGHFTFKFVVDGTWTTGTEYPVEADGFGGENNAVDVVVATKSEGTNEDELNGTMETEEEEEDGRLGKVEGMEDLKEELQEEQSSVCVVC